jgi:phage regulator Rha-like protein
VSPQFKLYLIQEFDRLKAEEQKQMGWSAKRELSKINYRIHTDAIKHNLIPDEVTPAQANIIYAEEADVLNVAMFGKTARQWRDENPNLMTLKASPLSNRGCERSEYPRIMQTQS